MKLSVFFAILLFVVAFALLVVFLVIFTAKKKEYGSREAFKQNYGFLVGTVFYSVFGFVFLLCR